MKRKQSILMVVVTAAIMVYTFSLANSHSLSHRVPIPGTKLMRI